MILQLNAAQAALEACRTECARSIEERDLACHDTINRLTTENADFGNTTRTAIADLVAEREVLRTQLDVAIVTL